ncbi:MAG: 2-C-methyl-D-erythritol 2,4-cyclodiphosphate synthase [Spirochaetales bacterium]|nr:2-C-methyl-D-erythritol 2,4-cyclodiphosphate synthase [Spirochaetales bacterium]
MEIVIGSGYDLHRLVSRRDFIIGGIKIDYNKGFLAHSDGDVLFHALIDSLLGALALGDIGGHFPDKSIEYKNIDSSILLKKTLELVAQNNARIGNIDITVVCQAPKLAPYILSIRENIAQLTDLSLNKVSVKAKTKEKVDAVGKGKAVEVFCSVLLYKD